MWDEVTQLKWPPLGSMPAWQGRHPKHGSGMCHNTKLARTSTLASESVLEQALRGLHSRVIAVPVATAQSTAMCACLVMASHRHSRPRADSF